MLEPLMMSKAAFDRLPKDQQAVIMAVGAELEAFARKEARRTTKVAAVYAEGRRQGGRPDRATVKKWQDIARDTAWKDFAAKNANCAKLLSSPRR
jgi:TRAP-type C4-dicarboxylate transport system substrate-binding protein